ncbi:amino acid ABC transporter substrate-binding protein [Halopseudomonas oceani]|nr:transporter substrate-binding domain-containing protein [Halopseudomonas oceani]GGE47398.1 amino acid ABC transporter substrate-binding protein [Halopseudomonas oceani]
MPDRLITRLILCLLLMAPLASASETGTDTPAPLRVGITEVPPFVIADGQGGWEGISVDLWRAIAEQQGWAFELQPMAFADLLHAVESGKVDVAVGALTMTAERELVFDFSHPFYQTGLSIGVPRAPKAGLLQSLKALFSWSFLSVIGGLGLLLLGVGVALWLFERHRNPEQFGGTATQGIGASFWWAAVTMTTVGYGDKAPVTFAGRLVALIWMFAGLIMVASFTAAITSALTVSNLQLQIRGPQDLPGSTVATIDGTASARYLGEERIVSRSYPDLTSAMQSVSAGETDAVVYDRPLLQYRNQQLGRERLELLPGVFDQQLYALAIPSGSPLRDQLNEAVLRVTESDEWRLIQRAYLGEQL